MKSPEMPAPAQEQKSEAEKFWARNEKQIRESATKLWNKEPEELESAIEREKNFITLILETAHKAQKVSKSKVQVLFDVDETLASHQYSNEHPKGITIIRPAAFPLLDVLKEKGFELGLFTTRSNLNEQIEIGGLLESLHPYLNPDLIFSTRNYGTYIGSMEFEDTLVEEYGGENGIIDSALIGERAPSTTGDISKLMGLKAIRNQLSDSVVIVDDSEYPRVLNEKSGLYGVALREHNAIFTAPF